MSHMFVSRGLGGEGHVFGRVPHWDVLPECRVLPPPTTHTPQCHVPHPHTHTPERHVPPHPHT